MMSNQGTVTTGYVWLIFFSLSLSLSTENKQTGERRKEIKKKKKKHQPRDNQWHGRVLENPVSTRTVRDLVFYLG